MGQMVCVECNGSSSRKTVREFPVRGASFYRPRGDILSWKSKARAKWPADVSGPHFWAHGANRIAGRLLGDARFLRRRDALCYAKSIEHRRGSEMVELRFCRIALPGDTLRVLRVKRSVPAGRLEVFNAQSSGSSYAKVSHRSALSLRTLKSFRLELLRPGETNKRCRDKTSRPAGNTNGGENHLPHRRRRLAGALARKQAAPPEMRRRGRGGPTQFRRRHRAMGLRGAQRGRRFVISRLRCSRDMEIDNFRQELSANLTGD